MHKAYASYHTHEDPPTPRDSRVRRIYSFLKPGYLAQRYGYQNVASRWQQALGLLLYLAPSRRAAVDAQFLMLAAKENASLLDVGCGNGQTMAWMASLGWQVQGIDTDPAAVQVAASKGLNVRQGSLRSQPFAAESFDVISMSHVIEHVHDPLSLMKECYRLLKPSGRLIVITPNSRSWGHRLYKSHWRGLEPPRHLQIFARPSLSRLSTLAGFASCECRAISRTARDMLLASRFLKRNKKTAIHPGLSVRLWAEIMSIMEWAGGYFDRDAGEELFLVAHKN
jgi:SAM-dependent methyltransferase